jgi:hypothetical protein
LGGGDFKRPGWPQLESVEGTIAAMRKESSVQQFITIREIDRRQSQAHEEKKARIIESKKKAAAAKVKLAAAVESADLMADIAMIEKAVAAASRKKTTLLDRLAHVSGHWKAKLDDMSDGMGHPKYFKSWYPAHYNDGVIPVHTRYSIWMRVITKVSAGKGVDPAAEFMK